MWTDIDVCLERLVLLILMSTPYVVRHEALDSDLACTGRNELIQIVERRLTGIAAVSS
jgi:hypothetical protein